MTTISKRLANEWVALQSGASLPERMIVAFSGGMDSTVLLHALASAPVIHSVTKQRIPILALHVDHQLHADSAKWASQCAEVAAAFQVEFLCVRGEIAEDAGLGPEAAARDARYKAMAAQMRSGDWLLCAHHCEDQAETLLLNLLRGSGPDGVAGMAKLRPFACGWLVRPLLDVARQDLATYAAAHDLRWVEDPSNSKIEFDRNFLRHDIVPRLESRWPNIASRLARSARHASSTASMLSDLAAIDLQTLGSAADCLPIDRLTALPVARQRNVIRAAIRQLGLSTPSSQHMATIMRECIDARPDAQPLVQWPGASVRRYRNGLYLLPQALPELSLQTINREGVVDLGPGLGQLQFQHVAHSGLAPALFTQGLTLRTRVGGEEIRLSGQAHTHKLKKLLQEEGIVPWMRDRLPLLYAGERLLAVGDLWLAAEAVEKPGIRVHWIDPPALH